MLQGLLNRSNLVISQDNQVKELSEFLYTRNSTILGNSKHIKKQSEDRSKSKSLLLFSKDTPPNTKKPTTKQIKINGRSLRQFENNGRQNSMILSARVKLDGKNFSLEAERNKNKTQASFYKPKVQSQKRSIKTAATSNLKRHMSDKIQKLPDFFSIKSFTDAKKPIVKDFSLQFCIFSERKSSQPRVHSRQSFMKRQKSLQDKSNKQKLIKNYRQTLNAKRKQIEKPVIQIGSKQLTQKDRNKTHFFNVIRQYRKAKFKYQREEDYTPWKRTIDHKDVDLMQLYEMQD